MKTLIKTTILAVTLSAAYNITAFAEETKAEAAKTAIEHQKPAHHPTEEKGTKAEHAVKESAKPEHKEMVEKAEHHAKEGAKPEHKEMAEKAEHHAKEGAKPEHKEMAEKAEHHAKEGAKPEHKMEKSEEKK